MESKDAEKQDKTWSARIVHTKDGRPVICIKVPHEKALPEAIRSLPDGYWHAGRSEWIFKDTAENRAHFGIGQLKRHVHLGNGKDELILRFERWLRTRRYSSNTIKTYTESLHTFLSFFPGRPMEDIGLEDIFRFNNEHIVERGLSSSYQNQVINALKLAFRELLGREVDADLIQRPRRAKPLPNVLSKEEVKRILSAHRNLKHRAMLSLIYSCGLRCSELLAMKPVHIDSRRNVVVIKQAKGNKDRLVPLSPKVLELLREYFTAYRPRVYLFEGQVAGEPYDSRSLQQVLKQAVRKCGIHKPVTLHWLRHSYATHLLESGTDLRYIQEILGHKSSKTTEIYTHVSTSHIQKIRSPFDDL